VLVFSAMLHRTLERIRAWRRERIESADAAELRHFARELQEIASRLLELVDRLNRPIRLKISQEESEMVTGVQAGGKGTFKESFLPAGSALPAGASIAITWAADDPLVTLTPSADGSSVDAAVDASDAAKSFNLTATGKSAALPADITSGPVSVAILAAAVQLPTALAIDQIA
jgi:hypothetical protein